MASRSLPAEFVNSYASVPAKTTVDRAISLHQNVREALGSEYDTLLQGSYKNDTALADLNDVDVVAVHRSTYSTSFGARRYLTSVPWPEIFARIERKLQADARYQGKWERHDKCIQLNTGVHIDIVPAIVVSESTADPVAIYSFREGTERQNWPRAHYDNSAAKSGRTNGSYKQAVRLFKRWAQCCFGSRKIAPSYYLECLLYATPDDRFTGDLAADFCAIARWIGLQFPQQWSYDYTKLWRVAGEGNVLTATEWKKADFEAFRTQLATSLRWADAALTATSEQQARDYWKAAYNGT